MAFRASVLSLVLTGALAAVSEEGSEREIDGRLSHHVERGGETEWVVVVVKAVASPSFASATCVAS